MWKNIISEDLQVTDLIYRDPTGTNDEQARIYLDIDFMSKTVDVSTSLNVDRNFVSSAEYHGLIRCARLNNSVDARELKAEIDEYLPVIEEIAEGFEENWNGHNWIGTLTPEAEQKLMDLVETLQNNLSTLEIGYTDAAEWYQSETDRQTIREDTRNISEIEQIAYIADCEKEALWDGVVLYGLERLIRELREEDE